MSETIYLSNVRLSFPKLVEAESNKKYPNSAKKFSADLLLNHNDPQFAKFMSEVGNVATKKWKDKANVILQIISADKRLRCWGNGSEKVKSDTLVVYEGYEGMSYIVTSAYEDSPPKIARHDDGKLIENLMERQQFARKLYGGCYVNAAVRLKPFDGQSGRRISCQLLAIQFCGDGPAFGESAPDVSHMFGQAQGAAPAGVPAGWPQQPPPPWMG